MEFLNHVINSLGIVWLALVTFALIDDMAGRIDKRLEGKAAAAAEPEVKSEVVSSPEFIQVTKENIPDLVENLFKPVVAKYAPKSARAEAVCVVELPEEGRYSEEQLLALTTNQLRLTCTESNIKWRDAHGKNKHLSVSEMRKALLEL